MIAFGPSRLSYTSTIKQEPLEEITSRVSELFTFSADSFRSAIDILLVAYVIYRLLKLVRGGRAWRIVLGVLVFVAALFASDRLGLRTLHYLLDKATILAPVAIVILLLPELRQALEGFSKVGIWTERFMATGSGRAEVIEEIIAAAVELSDTKTGALMVIERGSLLDDIAATGVAMDAEVSAPLLTSIFYGSNPLHDGAVIIRKDRIVAAACQLPMSESTDIAVQYHMRHRAGVGVTEQTDAVTLVVSEERGSINIALRGRMTLCKNTEELRDVLYRELRRGRAPSEEPLIATELAPSEESDDADDVKEKKA